MPLVWPILVVGDIKLPCKELSSYLTRPFTTILEKKDFENLNKVCLTIFQKWSKNIKILKSIKLLQSGVPTRDLFEWGKFYPKKVIQKKLSTNKWGKKCYPEVLSKNFFIQNVGDLFYYTLYD